MPLGHYDQFVVNAAQPTRRQIIEFKLSEEVLEEILNGNESIKIDMGQAKFLVGGTTYDFAHLNAGITNAEVYRLQPGSKQLDLVGDINSKCSIQKTHAKKGQKKATKNEPSRARTTLLDATDLKKGSSKLPAPTSARPTLSPSPSPAPATSTSSSAAMATTPISTSASVPTTSAASNAVPLKTRIVQLLAPHQRGVEERELTKLLISRIEDLQPILSIVANYSGGRHILKPEAYKEVRIYDWGKYSAKERDMVVSNASAAFDRLGLSPNALERDILLPEKAKRQSPPLVADSSNSKWRSGGGRDDRGSESEGFDNGRTNSSNTVNSLSKHSSTATTTTTQKKPSAKKPNVSATSLSKKKNTSTSSSKKVAAQILETVPNHSTRVATTPSSSLKPTLGGTPAIGIGSPIIAGRRPSINGNGNGNGVPAVKRNPESKKSGSSNKDTGGVGNGYKIPKVGSTLQRKPQSPTFTVQPITSKTEYEEVTRQFMAKYKEMKGLKAQIDKKKEIFDQLGADLDRAMGTDRESELKRKVQDAFGEDIVDRKVLRRSGEPRNGVSAEKAQAAIAEQNQNHNLSVRTMVERYKKLHHEAEIMKKALFEAGRAQAERVGQRYSRGGGGGGNG